MSMGISFFRLGKFSPIIFLKIFTGPLNWESSLSSIPIILCRAQFVERYCVNLFFFLWNILASTSMVIESFVVIETSTGILLGSV